MNQRRAGISFPTIMDAMTGVLVDACSALTNLEYLVVGGWVPYLRTKHGTLTHPGTKDVDLGFRLDQRHLREAAKRLGLAGYVPEATTPFVRYKVLNVKNRSRVFHADLFMKREVEVALDEKLWTPFEVEATVPSGEVRRATVPLLDEAGLIFMKAIALWEITMSNKRSRDAFDIYFILSSPSGPQVVERLRALDTKLPANVRTVSLLGKFVNERAAAFNKQVGAFSAAVAVENPAAQIAELLVSS